MITGTGISFRSRHWRAMMASKPDLPWLEVLADNFIGAGGMPAYQLETLAEHYPLTLHSTGLSIAGCEPLNRAYLAQLKALKQRSGATWLSDHLCFTHAQGRYSHDLLPIPYTQESLKYVAERLNRVQDYFGEAILIENPSAYLDCKTNKFSEAEFLYQLVKATNCKLLLDVNNIYLSQYNRQQACQNYLQHIPWESVAEIHLAGFEQRSFNERSHANNNFLIDAHNNPVSEPVWQLFQEVLQIIPTVPALVEWDNDLPALERLIAEQQKAEDIRQQLMALEESPSVRKHLAPRPKANTAATKKTPYHLKHWQQQFVAAIYGDPLASTAIIGQLSEQPKIAKETALSIYQNNGRATLISALAQCYKVCHQLIGSAAFRQQAASYVDTHPSTSQDLNQYGELFPAHLSALINQHTVYSKLPYLADMARYEYHYQSIYYAPNAPGNDLPCSPGVRPDLLSVALNQHCRLFTSPYPVSEIWHCHNEGKLEQLPLLSPGEREYCLLYRNCELQIMSATLDRQQFSLLQELADKAIVLNQFVAKAETRGLELDTLLPEWISSGWLSIKQQSPAKLETQAMCAQTGT